MLKNPECTSIFNRVKIFRANISCSKILNDKKYIANTVKNFREISVFQGKCKLFKNADW